MNIEHQIKVIISEESDEKYPYLDTKGIPTISLGFVYVDGVKVTMNTKPLTESQVDRNLWKHIQYSRKVAIKYASNYHELSSVRQLVLVNMAYQMRNRLHGFIETKKLIEKGLWNEASFEMLDSVWAREDSPARALRMVKMFRSDKYLDKYYSL